MISQAIVVRLFVKLVTEGRICGIVNIQCRFSYCNVVAVVAILGSKILKFSAATNAPLKLAPNFLPVVFLYSFSNSIEMRLVKYTFGGKMTQISSVIAVCLHR